MTEAQIAAHVRRAQRLDRIAARVGLALAGWLLAGVGLSALCAVVQRWL